MNKRLLAFLHKRGLSPTASDAEAWEFFRGLSGLDVSIANCLNHAEDDAAARTNCDVMIRALGHNPAEPWNLLPAEDTGAGGGPGLRTVGATGTPNTEVPPNTGTRTAGTDGGSAAGDLEANAQRFRLEGQQLEARRVQEINELGEWAGMAPDFVRSLTADPTITVEVARTRIREARQTTRNQEFMFETPGVPAQHTRNSQTDFNAQALECALMMRAGIDDPTHQRYRVDRVRGQLIPLVDRQRGQQLSDDQQRAVERGYELQGLPAVVFIQRALALDGIRCEPTPYAIEYAIQSRGAAGMSTTSLVNIFTQTFGARLMQGWTTTPDTTEGWVDVEDNPNYLPKEQVELALNGEGMAHLPRGAEAEDITLADSNQYTRVGRFARKAIFDDMDLVNDNFGVITGKVPGILGGIARETRPDLVYAILLANPTMEDGVALFHASHGNLLAASGGFAESTLEAAWTAMSIRRINGRNVNIRPTHIVHPATIDILVDKTIKPQGDVMVVGSTTDISTVSTFAMARRGLQHVGDSRLDNGVIDPKTLTSYAGDLNDWYLVAAGQGHEPITVSYLAGTRRSPRFRSGVLDRGQFGMWFDVSLSIGAKATHYETIRKMVQ